MKITKCVSKFDRVRLLAGAAMVTVAALGSVAGAAPVVAPNAFAGIEGDLNNCIPVAGCLGFNRYQQVFASSEFSAFGGPQFITEIAFRLDGLVGQTFTHNFSNVSVGLSTTAAAPDALSLTFANNRGADFTAVHSGLLALSATYNGAAIGPQAFDIVIALSTPFRYDPNAGNLLLDWQSFGGEASDFAAVDASFVEGDSVSRVWGLGAGDAMAVGADTFGLITQFRTAGIPEPGTLLLSCVGLFALLRSRRRR